MIIMKKLFLSILVLFLSAQAYSQSIYHRVKIDLKDKNLHELADLGLEVDHGHLAIGRYLENYFSEKQLSQIRAAGFNAEIVIDDVGAYYRDQMSAGQQRMMEGCFGEEDGMLVETPVNFTLGSMGGFYTYEEFLAILDDMQSKYPNLVSTKKEISNIVTYEGRPLYSLVISDNPEVEENEPQNLYTALHHAREPNGLTQLIFFMWHMLENYDIDPKIKEILDNTALHFIPMVNPDGYIFNQTTNPNGGGFWRKNRRNNGDGTFGVDLNRNYGFQWGNDDTGSSPDPDNDTYRGPSAFSEPETQAVKLYSEQHNFTFALNYHTYGNLLIYPWGYNDTPTPENEYFTAVSKELTKKNNYTFGTGTETVGYTVNGDADDWMYGEEETKNKIYSMTPEVGTQGFWPAIDEIVGNCIDNIQANISLATFLLNYPIVNIDAPTFNNDLTGSITYTTQQIGFDEGTYDVIATAISDNVTVNTMDSYTLNQLEVGNGSIPFVLDGDISFGEEIIIAVNTSKNIVFGADTIRFKYLEGAETQTLIFEEFGEDLFWIPGGEAWFYSDERFTSPAVSMTESINGNYDGGVNKSIKSKTTLLPESDQLMLSFDLWVEIENNYDFAILYIKEDGQERIPLCGKYSEPGSGDQIEGIPVYDGEFGWVREEIDITMWAGKNVEFQWRFVSDNFVDGDGFFVDDWSIGSVSEIVNITKTEYQDLKVYPNPANDIIRIDLPYNQIESMWLTNNLGQRATPLYSNRNTIPVHNLATGIYHLVLRDVDGNMYSKTVSVQK